MSASGTLSNQRQPVVLVQTLAQNQASHEGASDGVCPFSAMMPEAISVLSKCQRRGQSRRQSDNHLSQDISEHQAVTAGSA